MHYLDMHLTGKWTAKRWAVWVGSERSAHICGTFRTKRRARRYRDRMCARYPDERFALAYRNERPRWS